jgi:hypothetical protein
LGDLGPPICFRSGCQSSLLRMRRGVAAPIFWTLENGLDQQYGPRLPQSTVAYVADGRLIAAHSTTAGD